MKHAIMAALAAFAVAGAAQAAGDLGTKPITDKDQCHACDMWITKYPGPKGEIVMKNGNVYKFCASKCMLCTLQRLGENDQIAGIYVHDVSKTDWEKPSDDAFIDAKKAWFVGGSSRKATMGKSFAPLPTKKLAVEFQKKYGGEIYTYDQLTKEILGCKVPRKPAEPLK